MPTSQEVHDLVAAGVDAVKAHLDSASTRVLAAIAALQAEIDSLKAANPAVDFSDVEAKLANLQTEADAIAPEATPPPA